MDNLHELYSDLDSNNNDLSGIKVTVREAFEGTTVYWTHSEFGALKDIAGRDLTHEYSVDNIFDFLNNLHTNKKE